jgi:hypothetical protein
MTTLINAGSSPFLKRDPITGVFLLSYWKDDALWFQRYGPDWSVQGSSVLISSTGEVVPEGPFLFDTAKDPAHTLIGVYLDGNGDLNTRVSGDGGLSWSD